jgi:hypothetical protein
LLTIRPVISPKLLTLYFGGINGSANSVTR